MKTLNIAILISGRGSNMCALIKSLQSHPTANFCCVISDNPDAEGIDKANRLNVPTHVVNRKKCANKKQFEDRLLHYLEHHRIELILLAGFMSVLSAHFVARYTKKIINIHPSLLPKYRGLNTHQRALDNGDKVTGATVHWVNEEIDAGQTIKQCSMDIYPHDKAEQIAQRLLPLENGLYVEVVQDLLDQNEEIDAGRTIKQCSMDIYPHDKTEQIAQRLLPLENGLHVEVVQDLLDQN